MRTTRDEIERARAEDGDGGPDGDFCRQLRALGINIDALTAEQLEYMSSWETGT